MWSGGAWVSWPGVRGGWLVVMRCTVRREYGGVTRLAGMLSMAYVCVKPWMK